MAIVAIVAMRIGPELLQFAKDAMTTESATLPAAIEAEPEYKAKFLVLFTGADDTERAAWAKDERLTAEARRRGVRVHQFADSSKTVDQLNYRSLVTETGLPCVIVLSADGTVLQSAKIESVQGMLDALERAK